LISKEECRFHLRSGYLPKGFFLKTKHLVKLVF
jgi:hypothetical protein